MISWFSKTGSKAREEHTIKGPLLMQITFVKLKLEGRYRALGTETDL